jgi:aspartate aminotransferase-like enzyme
MLMKYRLFTPGPTSVPEQTLLELAKPVHHHRTAEFRKIFSELQELLQYVFQTRHTVYTITGSGTAAFESAFTSVLSPGMKVLNVTNGKFAERWASYAKTFGVGLTEIKLPYGQHVSAEQITAALKAEKFDAVVLVHSETSTATVADLQAIGKAVRAAGDDIVLIVDGITSIGAMPFMMDEWGVDVAVTGSQKALMLPPGLGYVALSDRARAKAKSGRHTNFYLDLTRYEKSLEDGDTPFTPANTLVQAQVVSLRMIKEETLEGVWKRTHGTAEAFRLGMKALGLSIFSQSPADSVSAVVYPAGIEDKKFRATLRDKHNVHVANGQGSMEGQLFRVNHMGYADAYDTLAVVAAIEIVLVQSGQPAQLGAGVTAVQKAITGLFA